MLRSRPKPSDLGTMQRPRVWPAALVFSAAALLSLAISGIATWLLLGQAASVPLAPAVQAAMTPATLYLLLGAAMLSWATVASVFWFVVRQLQGQVALLVESRQRNRAIVDNMVDGAIHIDGNGRLVALNRAAEQMFEYKSRSLRGKPLSMLLARGDHPEINRLLSEGSRHPADKCLVSNAYEVSGKRESGEEFPLYLAISEVKTGGYPVFTAIARDLTETRRQMAELAEARDQAMAADMAKSQFLAVMSHEIRTPMNGILGMLDLLLHTSLTNEQQECAQTARSSADALHAILSDILDLSKIEARKVVLDHEPFDLVAVLEGAKNVVAAQARIRELDLRLELDPELPRYRVGDSTRLRQVVLNLLGNAIKFTHVGGVCLRLAPGRDTSNPTGVAIEVEDTGIGITPVQQKRLFQAFSQAEGSTSREYGGTGLGLFISREFVALMGGTMSVHSEPGEGSTFRVELDLPMARAEEVPPDRTQGFPASETAGTSRTDAKALPQLRLLVVDDNRINLRVTERILSRMGYQCAVCASGSEAIAHVAAKPVDVVFMDCQMPEIDGYEATRRVRARTDEIVQPWIVALTANALEGDRERCLAAGMDDYISKPVKRERLEAVMARAAEGVRKRKFGE